METRARKPSKAEAGRGRSRLSPEFRFFMSVFAIGGVLYGLWIGPAVYRRQCAIREIIQLDGQYGYAIGVLYDALDYVSFSNTLVTDDDLDFLSKLEDVDYLSLDNTEITDAGLVHLQGLKNLTFLSLTGTDIGNDGLAHLKGLTKLERLWLDHTAITDAGMIHLKGLTKLKNLHIYSTEVTKDGVADLKRSLPDVNVID